MREDENCRRERHCDWETKEEVDVDDEGMQDARELDTEFCIRGGMMKEKEWDGREKKGCYINRASDKMSAKMNWDLGCQINAKTYVLNEGEAPLVWEDVEGSSKWKRKSFSRVCWAPPGHVAQTNSANKSKTQQVTAVTW